MANPYPDMLLSGQALYPNKPPNPNQLISMNGQFTLIMQQDGNLVLYYTPTSSTQRTKIWATNTAGRAVREALMQTDGNFVLYDYTPMPLWSSNTAGYPGSYLVLQNDGNLVIYKPIAVWATGT